MSKDSNSVTYQITIPKKWDDFITQILLAENRKRPDPKNQVTNEAFLFFIIRDWYVSMLLGGGQKQLQQSVAEQVKRDIDELVK